jgi:hypothetical protein
LGKETVLLLAWQGKRAGAQGEGGNGDQSVERVHGKDSGHIKGRVPGRSDIAIC